MKLDQEVILTALPQGFLDDLPQEDQRAISAVVGTRIRLRGFDELGRAELEFQEQNETFHTIFVPRKFIQQIPEN